MHGVRRLFCAVVFSLFLASLLGPSPSAAQAWPQRTVRFIVPLGAGSGADIGGRLLADRLSKKWGQPVVVENRPGGDGIVAISAFVSANDDHILLFSPSSSFTAHPYLHDNLPYKPTDLAPIARVSNTHHRASRCRRPCRSKSLDELVELIRAQPGKLNWAGVTGALDFLFEGFLKTLEPRHVEGAVSQHGRRRQRSGRGPRPGLPRRPTPSSGRSFRPARSRMLAVSNSVRAPAVPDIPTVAEAGYPALTIDGLVGLFGPPSMPMALRERIAADIKAVMDADPIIGERLTLTGQIRQSRRTGRIRQVDRRTARDHRRRCQELSRRLGEAVTPSRSLLDHLVGAGEQHWWNLQTERFRGLEVDHQLDLGRPLDRQVGGLGALEYLIHVDRGVAVVLHSVGPVAHQPAFLDVQPAEIDRRQLRLGRQFHDPPALGGEGRIWRDQQRLGFRLHESGERRFEVVGLVELVRHQRDRGARRGVLCLAPLRHMQRVADIDQDRDPRQTRPQLAHQVELLRRQRLGKIGEPGHVAARVRQALHQPEPDRVGAGRHHDRDRLGGFVDCDVGRHRRRDDDGRVEPDQFLGETGKAVEETIGEAVFVADIAPLDVAELPQVAAEGFVVLRRGCRRAGVDDADERNRWLLRACYKRPKNWRCDCRAAENCK